MPLSPDTTEIQHKQSPPGLHRAARRLAAQAIATVRCHEHGGRCATLFGIGRTPLAPGTAGERGRRCVRLVDRDGVRACAPLLALANRVGFWQFHFRRPMRRRSGERTFRLRERRIGGAMACLRFRAADVAAMRLAFVLFRLFDMTIIVAGCRRRRNCTAGFGIVADDTGGRRDGGCYPAAGRHFGLL